MRLIGLHGKALSGKNEFFDVLKQTYGFKHMSFASKVKEFGITYFGLTHEECYETKTQNSRRILQGIGSCVRQNITKITNLPKEEKILMGVSGFPIWIEKIAVDEFDIEPIDLKRKLKYNKQVLNGISDMFADKLQEFIKISKGIDADIWVNYVLHQPIDDAVYIITDVRYKNEKEFVEKQGGKTVKVVRIDKPTIEAGKHHISETDLDSTLDWFFTVVNEHKSDWRERLTLSGSNLVRKLNNINFFTQHDIDKFKIQL